MFWPRSGVQAGAGPPDVAGEQRQVDEAAGVVGAGDVLRDAHAPEDHGAVGASVGPRHVDHLLLRHPGQARHQARRVGDHRVAQAVEGLGAFFNELGVVQLLADDDVHQAVKERHVGAGVEAYVVVGVVGDFGPPRVGDE